MAIYWNRWVYAGLGALAVLSGCGLLLILIERLAKNGEHSNPSNPVLSTMAISAFMAFLACQFYYGWVKGILAQGRYLFVVLPALGILFISGMKQICPRRILSHFPYLFFILMVCLDLYALLAQLLPYYHLFR